MEMTTARRTHRVGAGIGRPGTAQRLKQGAAYAAMLLALAWTFFPFYCAFVLSIKLPGDFWTSKYVPFLQFRPTLAHWIQEWQVLRDPVGLGRGITNSLIVAAASAVLSLLLGALTAYGLRISRRGARSIWPLLAFFLLPRLVAPMVLIIPFTLMMRWLRLSDTLVALIFAHTTLALPLVLLFLYGSMADLSDELLDAARMDGCGELNVLRRIVVPLLAPMLLAAGVLVLAGSWNEFFFALTNAQTRAWTAPLSIASLITKDGIEFDYVGSHLLLVLLPPTLLVLLGSRTIVRALSFGTVKG
jgi:multiple sugar transport system permease protein